MIKKYKLFTEEILNKSENNLIKESKINLYDETNNDIEYIVDKLVNNGFNQEDDTYLTIHTPFQINPNSKKEELKNKLGLVLFVELLSYSSNYKEDYKSYGEQLTPWIACRIELEGERKNEEVKEILNWLINKITEATELKPFKDEDAYLMHWKTKTKNESTTYSCYFNPSYPTGWWENHTLG